MITTPSHDRATPRLVTPRRRRVNRRLSNRRITSYLPVGAIAERRSVDRKILLGKGRARMKRFAIALALAAGLGAAGAGTAGAADTNVGVQVATITQTSVALAPAVQFGGGWFSSNLNASYASAANYASITQLQAQINH
jgi:hypothetical protein